MITHWTLERFKSVYDRTTLRLAPLTVFAGANSSGKSTIIQSILLTTQTIQSSVSARPIVLNGSIVKAGAFRDVLSDGATKFSITIGFTLALTVEQRPFPVRASSTRFMRFYRVPVDRVECLFEFSPEGDRKASEIAQLQPRLESCSIKASATRDDGVHDAEVVIRRSGVPAAQRLSESRVTVAPPDLDITSLDFEVQKPTHTAYLSDFYRLYKKARPIGVTLSHFLPVQLSVVFDVHEERARRLLDHLLQPQAAVSHQVAIRDLSAALTPKVQEILLRALDGAVDDTRKDLPTFVIRRASEVRAEMAGGLTLDTLDKLRTKLTGQLRRSFSNRISEVADELIAAAKGERPAQFSVASAPLPPMVDAGVDGISDFFRQNVKYLGPLRDEPKAVYPLSGTTDPGDVGYRGEHTAAVLELHKNSEVAYVATQCFSDDQFRPEVKAVTLAEAVRDWLIYMGVADQLATQDLGKLGHALSVAVSGHDSLHDLTHVGVGVSQVLPILVSSLLSEKGSTLVFEQPELHLHPKVQTRLADFFVSLVHVGKQCVVETHSEYLVNRLRFRGVADGDTSISDRCLLYFVSREAGRSRYREIKINTYGALSEWPVGFFDEGESLAASILEKAMNKRVKSSDH